MKFHTVALGALSNSKEERASHLIVQIEANVNMIFCAHVYLYGTNIKFVSFKINHELFACRLDRFES